MRKTIICIVFLLVVPACVYDEIVISMNLHNADPIFYFKYLRAVDKTVWLIDVMVYEAGTRKLVWMISTYDPSLFYKFEDGMLKRIPSISQETPEIKGVQLSELTFGMVPSGFTQYYPASNEKPVLAHNVEYILGAGAGTSGRILFTIDGKCRRLSSTEFSEGHPLFKEANNCMP